MSEQGKPKVAEHPVAARQIARARAWGALIGFVLAFWLSRRAGLPFPESGGRALIAGFAISSIRQNHCSEISGSILFPERCENGTECV